MKALFNIINIPFLICMVFISCKKEDITSPVISVHAPASGDSILSGSNLIFKADMTDDQNLFQFTVIIEGNEAFKKMHPIAPFSYSNTIGVEDKSRSVSYTIEVPEAVATGNYLLTAYVVDYEGNYSLEQNVEFFIQNKADTIKPEMNLQLSPNPAMPGQTLKLQGVVTDNIELGALYIYVRDNNGNILSEVDLHTVGATQNIDHDLNAPTKEGTYNIQLILKDKVNNQQYHEISLVVAQ